MVVVGLERRHSHHASSPHESSTGAGVAQDHPAGAVTLQTPHRGHDQTSSPHRWGWKNWVRGRQQQPNFAEITDIEIYYGTMFGSAEGYARALARDISSCDQASVVVHDLDGFDEDFLGSSSRLIPSRIFVFVVSTHFAGAPPPSAERFRDWLNYLESGPRAEHSSRSGADGSSTATMTSPSYPPSRPVAREKTRLRSFFSGLGVHNPFRHRRHFTGMQFTVFGVGDSVYLTYNAMGKFVDSKLKQLGGTRFHALGLGDCSNDVDGAFQAWKAGLLLKLPVRNKVAVPPSLGIIIAPGSSGRRLLRKSLSASRLVFPSTVRDNEDQFGKRNALNVPDDAAMDRELDIKSGAIVRDLYGRVVPLRFACRTLSVQELSGIQLHGLGNCSSVSHAIRSPSKSPRTPRVALFDDEPFAEIEPMEYIGFSPSALGSIPARCGAATTSTTPRKATFRVRLLKAEATYTAVSTLAIIPQNSAAAVQALASAFEYNLDAVIELVCDSTLDALVPFPSPCTVRTALTEFIELNSLTREFLHVASGYVTHPEERELLQYLASIEGGGVFQARLLDQYKGILDLVAIAPSMKIPLDVFVNITGTIRPRYFTIASSPLLSPRELDLAVLLGRSGQPQGLTASYLGAIFSSVGVRRMPIRGFISSSRIQVPDDATVAPVVLIASGVGFSAMRAIIAERLARWMGHNHSSSRALRMPQHLLFLGTTNQDSVVFQNDLRHWEQQLVVKVHYAFSNDPRYVRRYVQDAVASRIEEVVQLVQSSGNSRVYVCGRSAMVHRIREIFASDQTQRRNMWFDTLRKSGRFTEEAYQ